MAKKTVKKKVTKAAAKPAVAAKAPVAAAVKPAVAGCGCGTGCACKGRVWKKILLVIVIFALGFATCVALCKGKCKKHLMGGKHHVAQKGAPLFDKNGCLNIDRVRGKFTAEQIRAADTNGDGCITREEFRNIGATEAAPQKRAGGQGGQGQQRRVRKPASQN
ncbi:MAG: hypothetical protein FWD33_01945 [Alphaproteobacteria bacterium]|nr:hypothetical protein [Alphaproteobacteria bacterium]